MTSLVLCLHVLAAAVLPSSRGAPADASQPAEPSVEVIEQATDPEFNLELPLQFAGDSADAAVTVRFDEQEGGARMELCVTEERVALLRVEAEGSEALAESPWTPAAEGFSTVTLRRRVDRVSAAVGGRCVLSAWDEATPGKLSVAAPQGVIDEENLYYQPYAPPLFTDDFMRGQQESFGDWQVVAGKWENTALVENLEFVPRAANSFAFAAHPESIALAVAGADFWDDYRCAVSVRIVQPGEAGLAFRVQDESSYYSFSLDFGDAGDREQPVLELRKLVAGEAQVLASRPFDVPLGQWYRLSVTAERQRIEAAVDGAPVFEVADGTFCGGPVGLLAADCETVYFDDAEVGEAKGFKASFEDDDLSRWQQVQGEWQIAADDGSPSAFLTTRSKGPSIAVVGRSSWTDYEYRVDFRPSRAAVVGLCFLWQSPDDCWVWRWVRKGSARQQLVRVKDGAEEVVDEAPLDLTLKDWHTAVARVGADHVYVSVDGKAAVDAVVPVGASGRAGLYATGGSPAFDNVRVEFPPGYTPARLPETMESDREMKEQFANPAEGWFSIEDEAHQPQKVGMNWNKGEYFGPVDVTFPLANVAASAGKVTVTIEGDQTAPAGGYDLVLTTEAGSSTLSLQLLRNGEPLQEAEVEVTSDSGGCQIRFGRRGSFVVVYVDDERVMSVRERAEKAAAPQAAEETIQQAQDDPHTATQATDR